MTLNISSLLVKSSKSLFELQIKTLEETVRQDSDNHMEQFTNLLAGLQNLIQLVSPKLLVTLAGKEPLNDRVLRVIRILVADEQEIRYAEHPETSSSFSFMHDKCKYREVNRLGGDWASPISIMDELKSLRFLLAALERERVR